MRLKYFLSLKTVDVYCVGYLQSTNMYPTLSICQRHKVLAMASAHLSFKSVHWGVFILDTLLADRKTNKNWFLTLKSPVLRKGSHFVEETKTSSHTVTILSLTRSKIRIWNHWLLFLALFTLYYLSGWLIYSFMALPIYCSWFSTHYL